MEGSLKFDRVGKATESQRGTWMPTRRRDRIKKKLVASCLAATAALCCCCCRDSDSGTDVDDEKALAKESFAHQDGL